MRVAEDISHRAGFFLLQSIRCFPQTAQMGSEIVTCSFIRRSFKAMRGTRRGYQTLRPLDRHSNALPLNYTPPSALPLNYTPPSALPLRYTPPSALYVPVRSDSLGSIDAKLYCSTCTRLLISRPLSLAMLTCVSPCSVYRVFICNDSSWAFC